MELETDIPTFDEWWEKHNKKYECLPNEECAHFALGKDVARLAWNAAFEYAIEETRRLRREHEEL